MSWEGKKKAGGNDLVSPRKEIPQVRDEEVEGPVDWEKANKQANNSDYCLL